MSSRTLPRLFLPAALLVLTACIAILRSQLFVRNPEVAAWGVTFDLVLTIPLLWWGLVVLPGRARALTLAPVFLVCLALASKIVPGNGFLDDLRYLAIPAELLLIGALVQRVRAVAKNKVATDDPYVRIQHAARSLMGNGMFAEVVASEVTLLYYALFCWRKQPPAVEGRAFTVYQRSGWPVMLACILVLLVAESIGLHLLLQLWSVPAAWLMTFFDAWGILWLLGDYHALRLRPSNLTDDALHLRYGMRWSVTIPRDNIASIEPISEEKQWKRKDVLKVAMLEDPRWLITLREPMVARGLAGLRKTIVAVALLPDEDEALL